MKRMELKLARVAKNLNQKEVGTYLGISGQEYCKIEGGKRGVSLEQAKLLIKLLKININML